MKDYREEFIKKTGHEIKTIDYHGLYYHGEYVKFLESQLEFKDKMIEAVEEWMSDIIFHSRTDKKDGKLIKAYDKYKDAIVKLNNIMGGRCPHCGNLVHSDY